VAPETVELPDLTLFIHAVAAGSLSAAGRTLKISPAVASKRLTRLEHCLGVRLLQRSSRRLGLTEAGATYYERVAPLLGQLQEAAVAASGETAAVQGTLRITATHAFGRRWLGPLAADFARLHPQVAVNLHLNDEVVDLLGGGFDLAVRIGQPQDSSLIARRVARSHMVLVASPAYLKKHGRPRVPADLARHRCIPLLRPGRSSASWNFRTPEGPLSLSIDGTLGSDSGELVYDWARLGEGITRKSIWDVADELIAGRLVTVLDRYVDEPADIHAVYPSKRFVPLRVRRFIEHMEARLARAQPGVLAAASRQAHGKGSRKSGGLSIGAETASIQKK
jgi:DNA-binding transcriptional LysR family regulator